MVPFIGKLDINDRQESVSPFGVGDIFERVKSNNPNNYTYKDDKICLLIPLFKTANFDVNYIDLLLSCAIDRNILYSDSDASYGDFTNRLQSLMSIGLRRNSINQNSALLHLTIVDSDVNISQDIIRRFNVIKYEGLTELSRKFHIDIPKNKSRICLGIHLKENNFLNPFYSKNGVENNGFCVLNNEHVILGVF